jgi:predicted transcriptional regulator of viral defense system
MKTTTIKKAIGIFQQHHGMLRTAQAIRLGIAPRTLYALRDSGQIEEVTRGLFRLPGTPSSEHMDLIQVALRIPKGIICLISALAFHRLTTQIPHAVYIALPLDAEKPRLSYPPLRLVWLSPASYSAGIQEQVLDNVTVRIYSREKTIADCFKFRNKVGLDVALEALKEGLARGSKPETLLEFARIDRVEKVMRPYLDANLDPCAVGEPGAHQRSPIQRTAAILRHRTFSVPAFSITIYRSICIKRRSAVPCLGNVIFPPNS